MNSTSIMQPTGPTGPTRELDIPYLFFSSALMLLPIIYICFKCIQIKIIDGMYQFFVDSGIHEAIDFYVRDGIDKQDLLLDIFCRGTLALGETYMAGSWESHDLYTLFRKIIRNKNHLKYKQNFISKIVKYVTYKQTSSLDMINNHYNLSNEFFESWLDKNMQYSCGYWSHPHMTLDEAQLSKMNLIVRKLNLKPGMRVLDIGCGWGMLAIYLAKICGVSVVGINLSTQMLKYANQKLEQSLEKHNLDVRYIYGDFAEISKENMKFDRIVSVGFYEHVGNDRYDEFYRIAYENLKEDGMMLLHTIGSNNLGKTTDPWILKYIFTRGQIPNMLNITTHAIGNNFVIEDVHNFGTDYGNTLLAWLDRFEKSTSDLKSDPKFYRMWKYYLSSCAASFHERELYLWQIIFTKKTNKNKYVGCR